MGDYQQANRYAVLCAGDEAEWAVQPNYGGAPRSLDAGVAMLGALTCLVAVEPRQAAGRQARVSIEFDAASTYTVTIAGTDVDTAADTDEATTLAAMASDINGDGTIGDQVEASVVDDVLVVTSLVDEDVAFDVGVAGGSGTIACDADACLVAAHVWARFAGKTANRPSNWRSFGTRRLVGRRGWFDNRVPVASIQRLYVELEDMSGHPDDGADVTLAATVRIAPTRDL